MLSHKQQLSKKLYQAEQLQKLDRIAIEKYNISGLTLMERAGAAAFDLLRNAFPEARRITVLCGTGNNGGDGYVVARLAHQAGFNTRLLQLGNIKKLSKDAQTVADKLRNSGLTVEIFSPEKLKDAEILLDALLGTGLCRSVSGIWAEAIAAINSHHIPVLSIDIPSGLNANTGAIMGNAVKATTTITFVGYKQGLFTGQGREYTGHIHFSDLGLPNSAYNSITPTAELINLRTLQEKLPKRKKSAHKGNFGHVLIIGGDHGFAGAAILASEAAARSGAGLVSLATRKQSVMLAARIPEIMAHTIDNPEQCIPILRKASVVAIGPGLGQSSWATFLLAHTLDTAKPLIVDADALNLLANDPSHYENWILTPHPGEAARLLNCKTADIQADRPAATKELQQRYGGTIVLKGSGTIIADQTGIAICEDGNPGMASGGMGDVLTGIIASFRAQNFSSIDAACIGVCVHAASADKAAQSGERGMLASDLMPYIREAVNP